MSIKKYLYYEHSKIIFSIILGLGLATIFRKQCKDDICIETKGPKPEDIKDKIFEYDGNCYKFKASPVSCDNSKKAIPFA